MTITAVGMGVAALISGMCAVAGGWCCSQLTSRVGKDMRMALYRKSMDLSIYDFRNFGTASITTRTINDVVNIQMAMTNVLCMLMPVPIIFIIALTLSFRLVSVAAGGDSLRVRRGAVHHAIRGAVVPQTAETA